MSVSTAIVPTDCANTDLPKRLSWSAPITKTDLAELRFYASLFSAASYHPELAATSTNQLRALHCGPKPRVADKKTQR